MELILKGQLNLNADNKEKKREPHPNGVVPQVGASIVDSVWMPQRPQELYFLQNVLPFFYTLLPTVRHFLDRHHLHIRAFLKTCTQKN